MINWLLGVGRKIMSPHYGCCTEYLVGISCTQEQTRSCWRGATISFGTQSKEEAAVGDHQRSNDQSTVCSFFGSYRRSRGCRGLSWSSSGFQHTSFCCCCGRRWRTRYPTCTSLQLDISHSNPRFWSITMTISFQNKCSTCLLKFFSDQRFLSPEICLPDDWTCKTIWFVCCLSVCKLKCVFLLWVCLDHSYVTVLT